MARLHELAESQNGDREEMLRNLSWSPTDEEMEEARAESGRSHSESGSTVRKFYIDTEQYPLRGGPLCETNCLSIARSL